MFQPMSLVGQAAMLAVFICSLAWAEQLYSLGFRSAEGEFNVINGKPYVLKLGERGPAGNAVDFKGNRLVHLASQKGLAYPLDGDEPIVSLGAADGTTDRWDLSEFGSGESRGAPVQAAEGKFKGWYLDWSDTEEELADAGRTLHVRRLILVREPKAVRKFAKYPVAK